MPSSAPLKPLPLRQGLLLSAASVLVFFTLLEGGLALIGVKPALEAKDPFVGFASNVPLFVRDGDRMKTASNRRDFFNAQSFSAAKAPGTVRIFCLGGSTTYGRPYDDATSFCGWLRELLPEADPSKRWEVINAGGVSYASYRVAHLMEELVGYEPDLFIVYTGHNEFLEKRTYGRLRGVPPAVRATMVLLARTRVWSAMDAVLRRAGIYDRLAGKKRDRLPGKVTTVLARSAGPERYTRDDDLRGEVLLHFKLSLERMAALSRSAGAKILFVAPASNLKDCSPFKSEHTPGLDASARTRSESLLAGAEKALREENWEEALEGLDEAVALDPRHAGVRYRRGRALLGLGRYDEAQREFRRARDEDVCPLRALTPVRGIVVETAEERGVPVVDFAAVVRRHAETESGGSIPGKELFLDHVHPTIEGNKLLASSLLDEMVDEGLVEPSPDRGERAVAAAAKRVEAKVDDRYRALALANLARVLSWAGKTEDVARLAKEALSLAGGDPRVAAKAGGVLSSYYRDQEEPEKALETLFSALKAAPADPELRLKLGLIQLDPPVRKRDKAAGNLLLACKLMPLNDTARLTFAIAMAKRGRYRIAYANASEALRLNPQNAEAKSYVTRLHRLLRDELPERKLAALALESYPSGAPRRLSQYHLDAGGARVKDGLEAEWYENGRLKRILDYDLGHLNGFETVWGPDGRRKSRRGFRQGIPVSDSAP